MSIAAIVARGYIAGVSFIPTRGYLSGNTPPPVTIVGGHFLPAQHGAKKRTLSNVQVIYNKAKELTRVETKELRDAISDYVEPAIARDVRLPDIIKINYEALADNEAAYNRFQQALTNIEERIAIAENARIAEDDELLLMTILACSIN